MSYNLMQYKTIMECIKGSGYLKERKKDRKIGRKRERKKEEEVMLCLLATISTYSPTPQTSLHLSHLVFLLSSSLQPPPKSIM